MNLSILRPLGMLGLSLGVSLAFASGVDEFAVKRKEVFAFTQKPSVKREGDRIAISFAVKDYCDVTVAIENADGQIIRFLGSGVLGPNAPIPFQKNSLKQMVLWDSKDEQGKYVRDVKEFNIRVSLGLKPRFERNLYWSPYKRISQAPPIIKATPEGVFVFEAHGIDSLKMFQHDGNYERTVYPFPASKVQEVKGLDWKDFPQGKRLPLKKSIYQQTLLTSGNNCSHLDQIGRSGYGATALAVRNKQVALAFLRLNRLGTDGTSGGAILAGGKTSAPLVLRNKTHEIGPTSAAISPDGKWLYLTGYAYRFQQYLLDSMHGVQRMALGGNEDAKPFVGNLKKPGTQNGEFRNASSVDVDSNGRVYVSDYMNNRIQVFSSEGQHLKNIPAHYPALVRINKRNGEIWYFSWAFPSEFIQKAKARIRIKPTATQLGTFEDPKQQARYDLPLGEFGGKFRTYIGIPYATMFTAEIDPWSKPATIWLGRECRNNIESGVHPGDGGATTDWKTAGIKLLRPENGKLKIIKDFGVETVKDVVRAKPPTNAIQRLYPHPLTGKLYIAEADSGPTIKSSRQWLEADPETGQIKVIDLPFNAMEGAFDIDGLVYLRNTDCIVRYAFPNFREVAFDYGEERAKVGDVIFHKFAPAISALVMPSKSPVCFHQGGINVSPKGHVIASCAYRFVGISQGHFLTRGQKVHHSEAYKPTLYPGRISSSTSPCIHVWDKHGKLLYEDAVPGVSQIDGLGMDRHDNIYFMHTPTRVLKGKKYFNEMSETMMKVKPKTAKFITDGKRPPVPLTEALRPKRPKDLSGRWVEKAEWFYGGVGFAGFNTAHAGGGCACWFSRCALDYFARSIVPEPYQFSVAVLDTNGNLILRIGRLGNVDTAGPGSSEVLDGDGVSLFHACFVGSQTDRRIFISDHGNQRIVSVKLDYHAQEILPLKAVKDQAQR